MLKTKGSQNWSFEELSPSAGTDIPEAGGDTHRAGMSLQIPPASILPIEDQIPPGLLKEGRGRWRQISRPCARQTCSESVRPSVPRCSIAGASLPPSVKITSRGGREQKPGWEGNKTQVSSSSSRENVSSWHQQGVSKPGTSLTSPQLLRPRDQQLIHPASI